ncbi:MAG: hypothetical protein Ct9H300mP25_08550 [Acidobacteriota bacterium]|nr:MAG: hypothetical protein Ct9H300mP25_08550 [Acidobacteriota bacterium]
MEPIGPRIFETPEDLKRPKLRMSFKFWGPYVPTGRGSGAVWRRGGVGLPGERG